MTYSNHYRHRGGQAESAGAGDDQDRHGIDDGVGQARLGTDPEPYDKGNDSYQENSRDKVTRDLVRQPLDRRAASLRIGNHLHDLGENSLMADPLRFHDKAPGVIQGAADHLVTRSFLNRDGFAG